MNLIIDLNALITVLVGGGIAGGIKVVYNSLTSIKDDMGEIKDHLAKLNGRAGKLETWVEGHEKNDNDRFRAIEANCADLRESVNSQINTLLGWKKE